MPKKIPDDRLYVVRLYNVLNKTWTSVTEPLSKVEAYKVWVDKTGNCTHHTQFCNTDYYAVYTVDFVKLYSKQLER